MTIRPPRGRDSAAPLWQPRRDVAYYVTSRCCQAVRARVVLLWRNLLRWSRPGNICHLVGGILLETGIDLVCGRLVNRATYQRMTKGGREYRLQELHC